MSNESDAALDYDDASSEDIVSRVGKVLDDPIIKAFGAFDHKYWPADKDKLESYGNDDVQLLFNHYESFFGDISEAQVLNAWKAIKSEIMDHAGLVQSLTFKQLWPRMLTHFTEIFLPILIMVASMVFHAGAANGYI